MIMRLKPGHFSTLPTSYSNYFTECDDKLAENHCMNYEDSMCYSPVYVVWAKENCASRCGYCPG